jgi:polysaccharide biosynthesis transport protein
MEQTDGLDIKRYLRLIYKKRALFALTAMVVTTLMVIGSYLMPKVYEAKSIIFIDRNFLNDLIKNVTIAPAFEEKVKALSIVMKSRSMLIKVMNDLDLDINNKSAEDLEVLLKDFQDKTNITVEINKSNRKDMDLFIVSFSHSDPKMASNYVNTLVRRYIEDNLSLKREEAYGANRFLVEQINLFKEKLAKTETEISRLKKDQSFVQSERLRVLQRKLNDLLVQYTESHPEVIKIRADIDQLKEQMAASQGGSARSQLADAARAGGEKSEGVRNREGNSSSRDIPAGNRSLLDLEREREMNKKIYEELLASLGKSEVSTQVEVQDKAGAFRILDPAIVPTKPVSPKMRLMIILSVLLGVAAGAGIVILQDLMDSSVRSVDMAKKLGLPVLAVIPTIQTAQETSRTRKKDRLLYTVAGVYLSVLMVITVMEMAGLPYVDNMFKETKAEIKSAAKNMKAWF